SCSPSKTWLMFLPHATAERAIFPRWDTHRVGAHGTEHADADSGDPPGVRWAGSSRTATHSSSSVRRDRPRERSARVPDPREDHDAAGDEEDARQLHEVRAEPPVLAEPQVLVERTFDAPQHHSGAEHDPRGVADAASAVGPAVEPAFYRDEDQVDGEVLHGLEDGHGQSAPDLAGVVHPEP